MGDTPFAAWTRRRVGQAAGSALATLFGLRAADDADAADKASRRRRKRRRNQNQNPNPNPDPDLPPSDLPDIIVMSVDDMRESDYLALPRTRALLGEQGLTYPNYFTTTPLCGPSRASLLTGQYAHNHGVLRNGGQRGGWLPFTRSGTDRNTVASWLRQAKPAYRTAHIGKQINGYKEKKGNVPSGWSRWVVPIPCEFYNYTLNVDGAPERRGHRTRDYLTDVLANKARAFIASTPRSTPLFLLCAPKAPHAPANPARRHKGAFADHQLDQAEPFNESDVSDKPRHMQYRVLDAADIDLLQQFERSRLESLLAVDEAVEAIVNALDQAGRLTNAYIFFVSDNGYLLGEHRRSSKRFPYEGSIRIPMLVRGPGISGGRINDAMMANIDLAPTIAALAGVASPTFVDGRSIADTFDGAAPTRQAMLIEFFAGSDPESGEGLGVLPGEAAVPPYRAIRTTNRMYAEYRTTGERELYDLDADPDQLQSLHDDPAHADEMQELAAWLATLETCRGAGCRGAEDGPPA